MPVSQSTKDLQTGMAQEGLLPSLHNAAQHELVFLAHLPPVGCDSLTICICESGVGSRPGGWGGGRREGVYVCMYLWPIVSPMQIVLWAVLEVAHTLRGWAVIGYIGFPLYMSFER